MQKHTRIVLRVQAASLADLARHHAAVVPRQAFALLPDWLIKPSATFTGLIARQCAEGTNKLKAMQAWFEGALAAVDDVPVIGFIDEDETLVAAMEGFEVKLLISLCHKFSC